MSHPEICRTNRQKLYQRAFQEKDNIKTNLIFGPAATVGSGVILFESITVPNAVAAFFGATVGFTPIGGVAALALGVSTVIAGKVLNDKKKSKDVTKIYYDDKDFLPILFYPSIYLIKKINANKLNFLKQEIEEYLPAEESQEFIDDFLNQEEREQEKMISESLNNLNKNEDKKKLKLFFIKESNDMCNKTKNEIGKNKKECEGVIEKINKIISKGIDFSYFEKDGIKNTLAEIFLLLFLKENNDLLDNTEKIMEELTTKYGGIRKINKSSKIKTLIYDYLKELIKKENDYEFLLNLPYDYAEYVKETLNTYKEEHLSKKSGSEKRVENYIENTVSELKIKCIDMIREKNPLLKDELIKFLFERSKQLENEHNRACNTINKLFEEISQLQDVNKTLKNEIQQINNIFDKLSNLFSKN